MYLLNPFIYKIKKIKRNIVRTHFKRRVVDELELRYRACILCGNNTRFITLYTEDRYGLPLTTVRCAQCNLIFTNPMPTETFLKKFYTSSAYRGMYKGYVKATEQNNDDTYQKAAVHIPFIEETCTLSPSASILDIGSGYGGFLLQLKKDHPEYRVYGIEPGSNFSQAHENELDGLYSSLEDVPSTCTFDLVTMWHVLEHTYNPIQTLMDIRAHLSPSGVVVLEVPDFQKYEGIRNIHIAHLFHFTKETLAAVAKQAGFSVDKITDKQCTPGAYSFKAILTNTTSL